MTTAPPAAATAGISAIRDTHAALRAAEVEQLRAVVAWVESAVIEGDEPAVITWPGEIIQIGGDGCPTVNEADAFDVCAALGLSTSSGMNYLSSATDLRYRLPKTYARTLAGKLPVWRARKIAEQTSLLSYEGAAHVDAKVHWHAHKISWVQLERLIAETVMRFDPEQAEADAKKAAESRQVLVFESHARRGMVDVYATLDQLDGHDLETALRAGAQRLADAGCEETLDVRRSMALGDLARGDQTLDLELKQREIVIHLHQNSEDVARIDQGPITVGTIQGWCSDAAKVIVKPVIDLNESVSVVQYEVPDRIRARVEPLHPTCVFPHCDKRSSRADMDHIEPYARGGPTSTINLAPLCRPHHRVKTTGRWQYEPDPDRPGCFLWTSPSGDRYRTGHHGTTPLT